MVLVEFPAQALLSGIMLGGAIGLMAVGIGLIWGVMEVLNFAYAEYVTFSMYVTFLLTLALKIEPMLTLAVTVPVFYLLGVGTYKAAIKRILSAPILAQVLVTFGLFLIIRHLLLFVFQADAKLVKSASLEGYIRFAGLVVGNAELAVFLVSTASTSLMFWFVKYTKTGKALRATAQNRQAALSIGIDVDKMNAIAWGMSTAAAAAAGTAMTATLYVHPFTGDLFIIPALGAVALGGFGNIYGGFIGGLIIGIVEVVGGSMAFAGIKLIYVYAIFLAILWFRPRGIFAR